jgi:hypothetical protein
MTYEPGQQVLVRGTVHPDAFKKGDLAPVVFDEPNLEGDLLPILVYVRAADVVGPAPATPSQTTYDVAADCLTALARVTAERDTLKVALKPLTHEYEPDKESPFCKGPAVLSYLRCVRPRSDPVHQTPAVVLARVVAEGGTG